MAPSDGAIDDVKFTTFFVRAQGGEEDAATSQFPVAATPRQEDDDGTSPFLVRAAAAATAAITRPWRSSGSSRHRNGRSRGQVLNGGVEISAAGIGKLTNLHTLGVVNVSGASGKALLEELKKLTQLRKLGVSGINRENWQELCHAISGHRHLESLSVHLDEDFCCCFSDMSDPPRTLKSLKVRGGAGPGNVHIRPAWLKQLPNLQKADLDVTILTREDIDVLQGIPQHLFLILHRLCVKPIEDGVSKLSFGDSALMDFQILEIDCGSRGLELHIGTVMAMYVQVIKVRCSSGSSLRLDNLRQLLHLKEVWLMGSTYDDDLKRDLLRQFSDEYVTLALKQVQEPGAIASSSS